MHLLATWRLFLDLLELLLDRLSSLCLHWLSQSICVGHSRSVCVCLCGLFSVCSSAHVGLSSSLAVSIFLCSRLSVFIIIRLCQCWLESVGGPLFLSENQSNTQLVKGHKAKSLLWMCTRKEIFNDCFSSVGPSLFLL